MIRADLIAAASAAADAATRARDPRHATTTGHVVAAALPVIVGAVTDEIRQLHEPEPSLLTGRAYCDHCTNMGVWTAYPCLTVRLLDALDAEAGRNEGETNG